MDIATATWFKNLYEYKTSEPRKLQEISRSTADDIYKWMAEQGIHIQDEFDDLFDGKMRLALPLTDQDTRNLIEIIDALRIDGWGAPLAPNAPRTGPRRFPTKMVKQKMRRLGDEGGGEYETELQVAKLDLEKTYDFTIPAGPRKGETIEKTEKTTMSKAIVKLAKQGAIRDELVKWWQKKQTFYTQDEDGYGDIEAIFERRYEGDNWRVIVSRHPVDVLRMSDVGQISSCHREGTEYFKCAVEESRGNGLIAYMVETEDLDNFLRHGQEAQSDAPIMHATKLIKNHILKNKKVFDALHKHLNDADAFEFGVNAVKRSWGSVPQEWKDEITYDMVRDAIRTQLEKKPWPPPRETELDLSNRANQIIAIGEWSRTQGGADWMWSYGDIEYLGLGDERVIAALRDGAEKVGVEAPVFSKYIQNRQAKRERWRDVVRQQEYEEALRAHQEATRFSLPPLMPLEDFDQKEIFRDRDRDIVGMVAASRLRIRKFHDTAKGDWIAVPEDRIYGRRIEKFRTFLTQWAWDTQKYLFIDEGTGELQLPREQDLRRYGGSYEDTNDGTLLNRLFSQSGTEINAYSGNVSHVHDEEEDDRWEQLNEELEEVMNSAQNRADHMSFYAELTDDAPYSVYGSGDCQFEFEVGWDGKAATDEEGFYHFPDEERGHTMIPKNYGATNHERRRLFERVLEEILNAQHAWPEEIEWTVEEQNIRRPAADAPPPPTATKLLVICKFNFEEQTPDEYDTFADTLLDDLDSNYDQVFEKMRRALVLEEYIAANDFDRLFDDIKDASEKLENWKPYGLDEDDDYDGEILFWFNPEIDGIRYIDPPLGIEFPKEIGNTPYAVEKLFDNGSVQADGKINPGISFRTEFAAALLRLQEAANNYAAEQLDFDFGKKYEKPTFEGVDLSTSSQIRFILDRQNQIHLLLKIIIESSDEEEEVEGAFKFMEFIDQYPSMIMDAAVSTFNLFWENYKDKLRAREQLMLDGTKMVQIYHQLDSRFGAQATAGTQTPTTSPEAAEQVMIVAMWIRDNWEKMDKAEKYTAIDQYLRPLNQGSMRAYGSWDNNTDMPNQWNLLVRAKLREFGAPHISVQAYTWQGEEEPEAAEPLRGTIGEPIPAWEPPPSQANESLKLLSVEEQIEAVDRMLNEVEGSRSGRKPIDLRIYKVNLGCIIDLDMAGIDSQIENQIRGIPEVTTVRHMSEMQKNVAARRVFRVYEIKFELYGQQARDTYRDSVLVPSITREVNGVKVINRGPVQSVDKPLREWGGLGYTAPPYDHNLPKMVTPRVSLQSVLEDWAEGGVQIYDTPMNTNQMRYHVMMPVSDLWEYASRYFRGTKTEFDSGYKRFIKNGPLMPVYIALGQNGRVKITGNEDLIWFAKKSGLESVPVFFSYQRQV